MSTIAVPLNSVQVHLFDKFINENLVHVSTSGTLFDTVRRVNAFWDGKIKLIIPH